MGGALLLWVCCAARLGAAVSLDSSLLAQNLAETGRLCVCLCVCACGSPSILLTSACNFQSAGIMPKWYRLLPRNLVAIATAHPMQGQTSTPDDYTLT